MNYKNYIASLSGIPGTISSGSKPAETEEKYMN